MEKIPRLKFHGKTLDQLRCQTYQSPVASLSELVANGLDTYAKNANITIPDNVLPTAEIVVGDNCDGMRFEECQDRYMNAEYDRRDGGTHIKTSSNRRIMGRKGMEKSAGFKIAGKNTGHLLLQGGEKSVKKNILEAKKRHCEAIMVNARRMTPGDDKA